MLRVQFCILAELYRRVRSFVPEQRQEAPRRLSRRSLQEPLPWGHSGRAAPVNSPRELGFLLPHLAISLFMNCTKFNKDSIS